MRFPYLPLALSTVLLGACVVEPDPSVAEGDQEVATAESAVTTPLLSGTYTTPLRSGTLTYNVVTIFGGGSGGWVRVDGKRYWGVLVKGYALTFYYGIDSTGPTAGTMILSAPLPDGTYPGTVTFYSKAGNVTDSGTVLMTMH